MNYISKNLNWDEFQNRAETPFGNYIINKPKSTGLWEARRSTEDIYVHIPIYSGDSKEDAIQACEVDFNNLTWDLLNTKTQMIITNHPK